MNKIRNIDSSLIDQNENSLCCTLLFGKENINDSESTVILNATIEYILATEKSMFLNLNKSNKSFDLYNSYNYNNK